MEAAVVKSDVFVLLIGRKWLGKPGERGTVRIWEPDDFVRMEIKAALSTQRRVLPVLANGAVMPEPKDLPIELQRLSRINAVSIRHAYFERDIQYLIEALLGQVKTGRLQLYLRCHPVQAKMVRTLAGLILAIALLLAGAAVHQALTERSLEETMGGAGQVWFLIAAVLAIGASRALFRLPRKRICSDFRESAAVNKIAIRAIPEVWHNIKKGFWCK